MPELAAFKNNEEEDNLHSQSQINDGRETSQMNYVNNKHHNSQESINNCD